MKTLATYILTLLTLSVAAQEKTKELADAENAFAKWALEHDTKEAFLKFMDTGAVVFDKGEIQKAKAHWEAKQPSTNKIIWYPTFAVISTSGDLGITTGPWEIKATAQARDTAIASGAFMTVWTKKNNEWKWNVDLGITHNLKNPKSTGVSSVELGHIERTTYDAGRYMLMAEQNFINAYNTTGKEAYNTVADNDIHLLNPNQLPVHGIYSLDAALVNMSGKIQFQAVGSGVSKDGDLGYLYGYATENGKKGNYLRVWRRISRKWMLIMQSLTI
jgi:ketosteroid isomerase-like protein